MQSVPTNLITGFLGVGKTTAVIDLLKQKAPGSRWAVLVNEYGDVSIDDALIAGTTHGRLDPAWLDLSSNDERLPLYPQEPLAASRVYPGAQPAKPQAGNARGWIFDPTSAFDEGKLLALLANARAVTRLKGV